VTLPLADAPALGGAARRTSAVRLALAAGLVGCLVTAYAVSGGSRTPSAAAAPAGRNVEVVLDLSGSVAEVSNPQTLRALRKIAATAQRVGLVVFSDSAEEVLPPGTPAAELGKVLRYFEPIHGQVYGPTPWSLRFTGGTSISSGLALARHALSRDHLGGSVVLVSDAADNVADTRALRRELVALARAGLDFHLERLRGSTPGDIAVYRRVYGKQAVSLVPSMVHPAAGASRPSGAPFPRWLVALALIAAALAAVREVLAVSLRWRSA
jgi:hypothetical protein